MRRNRAIDFSTFRASHSLSLMELTKVCNQIYPLTLIKWENVKQRQFDKKAKAKTRTLLVFIVTRVFCFCFFFNINAFSLHWEMCTWAAPSPCWMQLLDNFPLASQPYCCSDLWSGINASHPAVASLLPLETHLHQFPEGIQQSLSWGISPVGAGMQSSALILNLRDAIQFSSHRGHQ